MLKFRSRIPGLLLIPALSLLLILSACGASATATPAPDPTPTSAPADTPRTYGSSRRYTHPHPTSTHRARLIRRRHLRCRRRFGGHFHRRREALQPSPAQRRRSPHHRPFRSSPLRRSALRYRHPTTRARKRSVPPRPLHPGQDVPKRPHRHLHPPRRPPPPRRLLRRRGGLHRDNRPARNQRRPGPCHLPGRGPG